MNAQLVNETFDTYTVGSFDTQWNPTEWSGWFGANSNTSISDDFARSAPNSLLINSGADDLVGLFGTLDEGTYEITLYQYIPLGRGGYFNLQHNYTNAAGDWACELYFSDSTLNLGRIITDAMTATFVPVYDQWIENKFVFNFETDEGQYYYDGNLVNTWVISTSALGGMATNEINAINFFGTCDGLNCISQAYYDDISVVQTAVPTPYDVTVLTKFDPTPYTQIPDSLMTSMSLSAEIMNYGTMPVSSVQVTFDILDGNDNLVHTETSSILSSLGANSSTVITGNGNYIPANQSDSYTIAYHVNIAETDGYPLNNYDTLIYNINVTDSTYSKDDGNYTSGLGANGTTAIMGQNFEFVTDALVHSVTTSYIGGLAGDQIQLIVYKTDTITNLPIDDIYSSTPYTLPTNGGGLGAEQFVTFHIPTALYLDAGLYTFAINQMTTNSIDISTSPSIWKEATTVTSTNGGVSWAFLESFSFYVALNIRPNVSLAVEDPNHSNNIKTLKILELSPNPTKGYFLINMELSKKEAVQIDIFNIEGKLIQHISKGNIQNLQQAVDLTNESKGIYLVKITVGNESVTKRILIE